MSIHDRRFIAQLAQALLAASEGKSKSEIDAIARRALQLFSQKRLLAHAPSLFQTLQELQRRSEKRILIAVESKYGLSPSQHETLVEVLERKLKTGITIQERVIPDIIGGFRVRYGDTVIDATVNRQLKQLAQQLSV